MWKIPQFFWRVPLHTKTINLFGQILGWHFSAIHTGSFCYSLSKGTQYASTIITHNYGFHSSSLCCVSWSPRSPARAWCWKSPTCRSTEYMYDLLLQEWPNTMSMSSSLLTYISWPIYCLIGAGLCSRDHLKVTLHCLSSQRSCKQHMGHSA